MEDRKPNRSVPLGIIAAVSTLVIAVGGGTAWWTINSRTPTPSATTPPSTTVTQPPQSEVPPAEETVQVYWIRDTGNSFQLSPSAVSLKSEAKTPQARLEAALNSLLAGTDKEAVTSAIPSGTKLRSVSLKNDGIYVDLSKEFTSGGGSASMSGRLWQVVYTATTINPNSPVWILVEGKPVEYLGGEGLTLDQPLNRQSVTQNFPL